MTKLPFIPGQLYRRSELHDQFGGNRQSGICPTSQYPYIFIFSGSRGKQHGYKDQWENPEVFSYTGEGQTGNMQFTRGNLALRDHQENGKRVFLFEYEQVGYVKFVSELTLFDADYYETHDTNGDNRVGIKFFFHRTGAQPIIDKETLNLAPSLVEDPNIPYDILPNMDGGTELSLQGQGDEEHNRFRKPNVTERAGIVQSRVGQGAYRKSILHRWEYKCGVTDFNDLRVLIASHIVPWRDATDDQRLDVDNGILLSPTYDALFDRHLITFDQRGRIQLSDQIEPEAYQKIGVDGRERLKKTPDGMKAYLEQHQRVFEGHG